MKLVIDNASFGYKNVTILKNVSLHLQQGEIVCILGPNGIGKTTIFRSIMGFLNLIEGDIFLNGISKEKINIREFAKIVSYVPQHHELPFPYSVIDVIVMGRAVHLKIFETPSVKDYCAANQIMKLLGIYYLRNKKFTQISGGEQQMVLIARALVQNPKLLIMDEPTANLDYANQVHVLECIQGLTQFGLGVLMTTHNPDHAFLCCNRVILLTKDKVTIEGSVDEIITESNLYRAYGVKVKIIKSIDSQGHIIKSCIPILNYKNIFKL